MQLEQRRQAMLQQHLGGQQFYLPTKELLILEVWRYVEDTSIATFSQLRIFEM